jgi:hypothetical protein
MRGEVPPNIDNVDTIQALLLTGHQMDLSIAHVAAIVGNVRALESFKDNKRIADLKSHGIGTQYLVAFAALLSGNPECISFVLSRGETVIEFSMNILHYNACLSGCRSATKCLRDHLEEHKGTPLSPTELLIGAATCGTIAELDALTKQSDCLISSPLEVYQEMRVPPMCAEVTPLHLAALCGNIRLVTALLQRDKDLANRLDKYKRTPMFYAAVGGQTDIIRALSAAGAALHTTDEELMTPVHFAAMAGQSSALHYLTAHRAPCVTSDKNNRSALHYAAYAGRVEGVKYILQFCSATDKVQRDCAGYDPSTTACRFQNEEVVNVFAECGFGEWKTPPPLAAKKSFTMHSKKLLKSQS